MAVSARDEPDDVLHGDAFRLEALRSERARLVAIVAALGALLAFVVVRNAVVLDPGQRHELLPTVVLGVVGIAYEMAMLGLVTRQLRRGRPMPEPAWWLSAAVESLFPALVLVVLVGIPLIGPQRALTFPALAIYFIVIILCTLRLRPLLCVLSGVLAAGSYLGVVAYALSVAAADDAEGTATGHHPAVLVSWAVTLLVAGVAAGAVASRIRGHVAAALREARERQRATLRGRDTLIFGLAKLAEYRDTDTGAHLERIATYVRLLAEELRDEFDHIDDRWIETLAVASSMHDIGKVGIPDRVLLKPGRLTDDERRVIERHPGLGSEALKAIRERHGDDPLLVMSDEIAREHHERWDGGGYPSSVAGPEIALPARIIAVADVYDALTSERVYKPAFDHEKATRIIREGRGTQFDPVVVDAFLRIGAEFDAARARSRAPSGG